MLDFRRKSSSRNGHVRHERRRLLALVLLAGLTLILISKASDPSIWRLFDLLLTPPQGDPASGSIDNRLDAVTPNDTLAGAFLTPNEQPPLLKKGTGSELTDASAAENRGGEVPAPLSQQAGNRLLKKGTGSEPTDASTAENRGREVPVPLFQQTAKDLPPPKPEVEAGYFPGVNRQSLNDIRDDAPSSRGEEACSLQLLELLNRADSATLDKASIGPVTYAQLFRQPNQYRGRLVTVTGIVRRANRIDLFQNEYGINAYYQIWLWPSDNPASPIVIYCLDLPKGFPTGMEFVQQAEVTGFFFKRWAYLAKDTLRTAPTMLAKTLDWQKRPLMTAKEPAETWAIPMVVSVALLIAMLAAFVVYLRTRPTQPALPDRPPNFDGLQ